MKSYLCIGGPLHGETHAPYGRELRVPSYGVPDFIGTEQLPYEKMSFPAIHETRYVVKDIGIGEQYTTNAGHGINVRININVTVSALVHESVLTIEEAAAYYRKQRPLDVKGAVRLTLDHMKLPNGR